MLECTSLCCHVASTNTHTQSHSTTRFKDTVFQAGAERSFYAHALIHTMSINAEKHSKSFKTLPELQFIRRFDSLLKALEKHQCLKIVS